MSPHHLIMMTHAAPRFRVVHWNVRRCVDLSGASSLSRVLEALRSLQPSLLSLNEVDLRQSPSLLSDLSAAGLPHSSFFGHMRGTYGNLLAATVPLRNVLHLHLRGGSHVRVRDGRLHRIARGLLCADFSFLGVELRAAATHLDHISSVERRRQTHHLLQPLRLAEGARQCLLLGDLNALCREDFTSAEWEAHERHNRKKGWAPPVDEAEPGGVLSLLREARFVDAYAAVHPRREGGVPPWTAHVHDAEQPRYRIDYVWSRPPLLPDAPRLVPCEGLVHPSCDQASDHQPLVIDFVRA
ncbi:hypothetical protein AB1Y20_017295 [Prymnesium parvum]|uniref:Endonuclease/exonuclease/phosphatase domain-containing protein n=1 Tax=Prymnesium parvum TaxID=97485 RepID=A0AB34JKV0_PRYPA